jgi:hypothetical protein
MTFMERCKDIDKFSICPGVWNLREVWEINKTRGRFFNLIFFPAYILVIPILIELSLLMMFEVWLKGDYDHAKKTTEEKS